MNNFVATTISACQICVHGPLFRFWSVPDLILLNTCFLLATFPFLWLENSHYRIMVNAQDMVGGDRTGVGHPIGEHGSPPATRQGHVPPWVAG